MTADSRNHGFRRRIRCNRYSRCRFRAQDGRVHLDLSCPDGTDISNHFLSHAVIAIEGDVVAIEKGFFRVTAVTRSADSPDLPGHLRALNRPALSGGMINFFWRAN